MTPRPIPNARVLRLRAGGYHDGRIQRACALALARGGGQCDTAQACEVAYGARPWIKGQYRNTRKALDRIAVRVGRSTTKPGRPVIWRAR
jgi:hypothetical protein